MKVLRFKDFVTIPGLWIITVPKILKIFACRNIKDRRIAIVQSLSKLNH